jgi:hypothetical protein
VITDISFDAKSTLIQVIRLALAKGRTITIGTATPALRYRELREEFPDIIMVIEEQGVRIMGNKK